MITIENDFAVDQTAHLETPEKLAGLLSLLCGEIVSFESLSEEARSTISDLLAGFRTTRLTWDQFNELLLLFNQDRVQEAFFKFFFSDTEGSVSIDSLKAGVRLFRGYAMLAFGNFRFAFRRLSQERHIDAISKLLSPWHRDSAAEELALKNRRPPLVRLTGTTDHIEGDKTWLLGYLSSQLLRADSDALEAMSKQLAEDGKHEDVVNLKAAYGALQSLNSDLITAQAKGRRNTVKYLTWDHLDVYVATSMRQRWEFENTFRFVSDVFQKQLADLPRIRWFDPTQSYSDSIIDKGLVEALMLKRAKCTIYMAQEGDTLGKDSELAATLAQGKPVIVYVPKIDGMELKRLSIDLAARPLPYFRHRLLTLLAEGFFDRPDNRVAVAKRLQELDLNINADELKPQEAAVQGLLQLLAQFERERRFLVIGDEQANFRERHADKFREAGKLLAALESVAADGRASTIKLRHPLGMQVHLETGVANGVLVSRSSEQCGELIRGILTRKLTFDIESVAPSGHHLGTALIDKPTGSRFRFVTADECLTNSFWNFYLDGRENGANVK